MPVNLLDFSPAQLERYLGDEKPYRARQLVRWIHQRGEHDFSRMSDLKAELRARLDATAIVAAPKLHEEHIAPDGTRKWLLEVDAANKIETVFIPEDSRGTLCISSQAGCALACTFCSTGRQGFGRNLTTAEIIGQLWFVNNALENSACAPRFQRERGGFISNVVFMGMGEPLLNLEAVVPAIELMLDDRAYGLSRRKVTVSTSGIVPAIRRLGDECPVALAVSLHAANDALRDELVPINTKYPLRELMAACRDYVVKAPRDFVTFEYVMLKGVNDELEHARQLVALVRDVPCKINLIPFNPFPDSGYERSSSHAIESFAAELHDHEIVTTVRKTRGEKIDAACGQLAGAIVEGRSIRRKGVKRDHLGERRDLVGVRGIQ